MSRAALTCLIAWLTGLGFGCTPGDSEGLSEARPRGALTFCRDIAPIIFKNCSICHRPGEAAPFSLLSYGDVRARAKQIAMVTQSRYMPPWLPKHGRGEFVGERRLTEDQIGTIAQWVKEGAKEGDPADLPPRPTWQDGWLLGPPDLVLELREAYEVPADGPDVYRNFVFSTPVLQPTFVRTVEVRPDNRRVAHHALLMADRSRTSRRMERESPGPGFGGTDGMELPPSVLPLDGFFSSWNPGKMPFRGFDDMAWRLDPGADMVLQMHLQPSGKPEKIKPTVGLYFAKSPPKRFPVVICLRSVVIDVAAGEKGYSFETNYTLPLDVDVLGVLPHAHYICKEMQGYATLPDNTTKWLLHIEDWDFNWQGDYRFKEPVFLPKGTRITQRYTYDNSADNPRNPQVPPVRVRYGPNSVDEMGELWIQLLPRRKEDKALLESDFRMWRVENVNIAKAKSDLENNPNDWEALLELAKGRAFQGRKSEAFDIIDRAIHAAPEEAEPHRLLAYFKIEEGTSESLQIAIKHLTVALRLRPDYTEAYSDLGRIYLQANDLARAARCFKRVHDLSPDDPVPVYNLGLIAFKREDVAVAAQLFKKTLEIDPSYTLAQKALSLIRESKR